MDQTGSIASAAAGHAVRPVVVTAPGPQRAGDSSRAASANRGVDQVEISQRAREAGRMQLVNDGPIRRDLVNRIRTEIDARTYETSDKIEIAAERLANALDMPM